MAGTRKEMKARHKTELKAFKTKSAIAKVKAEQKKELDMIGKKPNGTQGLSRYDDNSEPSYGVWVGSYFG